MNFRDIVDLRKIEFLLFLYLEEKKLIRYYLLPFSVRSVGFLSLKGDIVCKINENANQTKSTKFLIA